MRRALVLLLLVLPVAACGSDDDDTAAGTSTSTSAPEETTTTIAEGPIEVGAPVSLGAGTFVGVHPTEAIAYVSIVDDETDEVGCEGGDVARLWAQPFDGGAPVRALPDSFLSGIVRPGGAGGRVAVVDECEGFLSSLTTARPNDDGTFADVMEVDTTPAEESGQLMPSTIRWSRDGESFLALVHDLQGDAIRAVRIGLDGQLTTLVEGQPLLAVEELADGRLVTATEHTIRFGDEQPVALEVTSIALDAERTHVAVFGSGGTTVVRPGVAPVNVDPAPSTVGSWSADGHLVAYLRLDGDQASVWMSTSAADGEPVALADRGGFGAPSFTSDGAFVAYNDAVDSGQGFAEPRATARPIS